MDELEKKCPDLVKSIRDAKVELLEAPVVKAYVEALRSSLVEGPSSSKSPFSTPS
jgi:hypothetical protein